MSTRLGGKGPEWAWNVLGSMLLARNQDSFGAYFRGYQSANRYWDAPDGRRYWRGRFRDRPRPARRCRPAPGRLRRQAFPAVGVAHLLLQTELAYTTRTKMADGGRAESALAEWLPSVCIVSADQQKGCARRIPQRSSGRRQIHRAMPRPSRGRPGPRAELADVLYSGIPARDAGGPSSMVADNSSSLTSQDRRPRQAWGAQKDVGCAVADQRSGPARRLSGSAAIGAF